MAHLLLIDDDPALVEAQVRQSFPRPHVVSVARDAASGLAAAREITPDVVLLDLRLPDRSGLEVFEELRSIDARIPVVFVTMAKTADTAIEAMKRGAFNYLFKPLDLARLRATVNEALEVAARMRSTVVLAPSDPEQSSEDMIFGACPAMLDVYKSIGRVAAQDVSVLITGESGTGKELVARAIYQHSARAKAPFLALNCGAIPENLLESELFGHERGAFTSADRRRIGKFEQCNGGTILLDEIGDMPIALQVKLLRVIQEQTFERVGGNETIRTDVRILAATHRDLHARAEREQFRSDLYYRLGVFTIALPALRDRGDDLPILAEQLVRRFAHELGREVRSIAPDAMERLRAYSWPGNVRELQSVLKQALLHARGTTLLTSFLPELKERASDRPRAPVAIDSRDLARLVEEKLTSDSGDAHAAVHREVDRILLKAAIERTSGNYRDAARLLGISRQTMRMRLRALGIYVARTVEQDEEGDG